MVATMIYQKVESAFLIRSRYILNHAVSSRFARPPRKICHDQVRKYPSCSYNGAWNIIIRSQHNHSFQDDHPKKSSSSNQRRSPSLKKTSKKHRNEVTNKIDLNTESMHSRNENKMPGKVRLSKRMSELDLCSRREADSLISRGDGSILIRGLPIEPTLGQKVDADEMDIRIVFDGDDGTRRKKHGDGAKSNILMSSHEMFDWDRIQSDTIVLHKPLDYVSGQPDPKHGHRPAVQLLTRSNFFVGDSSEGIDMRGNYAFASLGRRGRKTLSGYVPAGRLDKDSTGLLIFTRSGVIAKKLVSARSELEKEYIVQVERHGSVENPPKHHSKNSTSARASESHRTPREFKPNLSILRFGGEFLKGEHRALLPLVKAEWQSDDTLRVVLREGRKRQIRRMCKELLGLRVLDLKRIRIGSVKLESLPAGSWRPLAEAEARSILNPR